MKAKIHTVTFNYFNNDLTMLVWAQTRQGAVRDALQVLAECAGATVSTGEELYDAGRCSVTIHGEDRYRKMHDPRQTELPGIEEAQ